jgi:nucleoside-diphosphate-sugar epimerase
MESRPFAPPINDVHEILVNSQDSLQLIRPGRVLITGGAGFIGSWISRALAIAKLELGIGIEIDVVSRKSNLIKASILKEEAAQINFHNLDLNSNKASKHFNSSKYNLIIHSAVSSLANQVDGAGIDTESDNRMLRNILESSCIDSNTKIMYLSSGAIYRLHENRIESRTVTKINTNQSLSEYAKSKLENEIELKTFQSEIGFQALIPRIFTIYGPGLSIQKNFAITQFISNSINRKEIVISGNKRSLRSYLYVTDLIEILIKLMTVENPKHHITMDVGSSEVLTIENLAKQVANVFGETTISGGISASDPDIYLPNEDSKLILPQFEEKVTLDAGLRRWRKYLLRTDN